MSKMTKALENLIQQMSKDGNGKCFHFNQDGHAYIVSSYRVLVLPYTVDAITGYRKLDHKNVMDGYAIKNVLEHISKLFRGNYYRKDVTRKLVGDIKEYEREAKALKNAHDDIRVLYSDGRSTIDVQYLKQGDIALHFTGMYSEGKAAPVFFVGKDFDNEMYFGRMNRMDYPLYMVLPVNKYGQHEGCETVTERKAG